MSVSKIFAFERLFDRGISVLLLTLGAVLAGATAIVGA